eukprot:COSAG05_NODE_512_length_9090_cov_33.937827_2_plen_68_part_00
MSVPTFQRVRRLPGACVPGKLATATSFTTVVQPDRMANSRPRLLIAITAQHQGNTRLQPRPCGGGSS